MGDFRFVQSNHFSRCVEVRQIFNGLRSCVYVVMASFPVVAKTMEMLDTQIQTLRKNEGLQYVEVGPWSIQW